MKPEPYPLILTPHLSRRLWGAAALADWLNLPDASGGDPWGESWQVWAGNVIVNGPLAGRTLRDAVDIWGEELTGTAGARRYGRNFPLLAKFIGAARDLSLQVHPDDDQARRLRPAAGEPGKSEAWLILQAEPGAFIYRGFRSEVTVDQVRAATADDSLDRLLLRVPVRPGDVIWNPPGTVHAVGAGLLLYEIQQPSDITFRLYDFGRRDSSGRLRELHIDDALAVADLSAAGPALTSPEALQAGETLLVSTPEFILSRIEAGASAELTTGTATVELLTALDSPASLTDGSSELELPAGTSLVLPAEDRAYSLRSDSPLLRARLPES